MHDGSFEQPRLPPVEQATEWLRGEGDGSDVVMSSRVRLARNLAGFPFMPQAGRTDRLQVLEICKRQVLGAETLRAVNGSSDQRMMWIDLHEIPKLERALLVERHLISKQHARGKLTTGAGGPDEPRAVAVGLPDERLSIMVNEEDHLRIQMVRSGLALSQCLADIDDVDDAIEAGIDYAFNPRFGYLTACPTNVGTGVRLSVMLHLPALKIANRIDKAKRAAEDMRLAVRGFYGEGSEAAGDFYQISNQTTLGKTEHVLLHELEREMIPGIIDYERRERRRLLETQPDSIRDRVFRALGLLRHSRLMSAEEAMQQLSHVRLGVVLGLIEGLTQQEVNNLMLLCQRAHLQRVLGTDLDAQRRKVERAGMLRARLCAGAS